MPHHYRVAIAKGFKIPFDWFSIPWSSEKAFATALRRHRLAKDVALPLTLSQIAASFAGATRVQALPEPDADHHSASRRPLFERFREEVQAPGPGVLVVEGVSGYGKSSFVSLAVLQLERLRIRQLVLAVQCRDRTGEQIVRHIKELVCSVDDRIKDDNPQHFFEHVPAIVILDDADKISGVSEKGGAPIAGALLAELLAVPMQGRRRLKVILTMRSSKGPAATLFEELSLLTDRAPIQPIHLDPLTTEDVAAVLRKKLKYQSETSTRFARIIGGDPIAVSTFVASSPDDRLERVEVLANDLADGHLLGIEERTCEMQPLLDALQRRSRVAVLTAAILTFSPGAVDLDRCQRLVDKLIADSILKKGPQAVPDDSVRAVLREVLDDFTVTSSTQTELHPRVRATFRILFGARIGMDALRQIHRRMAQSAVEPAVLVDGSGPTPLNFSSYYAILHHLIALYWLAPAAKHGQVAIQRKPKTDLPSANDIRALELLLDSDECLLDRTEIVNVTYASLMLSRVDPDHGTRIASRQFGDYERKLKMLTMFTKEGLKEKSALSPLPELAMPYMVQLLLDIAVCATQSGLLEIAREAIHSR
ncbi:MAG: NACHT domain-containing protein, partial [Allosphingosinicella sp.]